MRLSRRQLLHTGVLGGLALAVAGRLALPPAAPGFAANVADRQLITVLARGMLGPLPASGPLQVTGNVLAAIDSLPLALQTELRQLFDLLQQPLARHLLAGVAAPWQDASDEDVRAFLQRWRHSRLSLLRSGYQALHSLLYAAWYGDAASWPGIDYRLPPTMKGLL